MTDLENVDLKVVAAQNILAKGAREWSNEEAKQIEKLIKEIGRDEVRQIMLQVRGGEKPTPVNEMVN